MKEYAVYENSDLFLHKISHSNGTWTNFGKVFALESTFHIFFLFSFLIIFFVFIILPGTVKSFDFIITSSIQSQFNKLKDDLDKQLTPSDSASFYTFMGLNGDYIFSYLEEYFNSEDTNMTTNNYFIWVIVLCIIAALFVITALFMAPYFEKNRGKKLLHIMILNLFILGLIGGFEGLLYQFVLRAENHITDQTVRDYVQKSFEEKFNILLDNPSYAFNKREPLDTLAMILIFVLIGLIILTPIIWFYIIPKIIRLLI